MSEQSNIKKGLVLVVYVLDTSDERCNAMSFAKDSKTGRFRCIASYQSGNLDWAKCNIRLLCKSEYEKTFPQGYEIEDAGEVVTLRGELIEFFDKAQEILARKYAELAGEAETDNEVSAQDGGVEHNAARLRDALQMCLGVINRLDWIGDGVFENGKYINPDLIASAKKEAEAALAAPPRNCERFQTTKQAKEAYFAEVRHVSVWDGCETERLVDWLLSTATEKEGGKK